MSPNEYMLHTMKYRHENPQQRLGQALFNVLVEVRPDISEEIRGGILDPFYRDDRVPEFLELVLSRW